MSFLELLISIFIAMGVGAILMTAILIQIAKVLDKACEEFKYILR